MKQAFTMADRLSRLNNWRVGSRLAFTMAEILLSLTIIGVVAAITLPSLTGNINERTWNTQRKALYARFSQAIALMPALNGYGTVTEGASGSLIEDNAAEVLISAGLAKVLKINNICSGDNLSDCGVTSKFTNLAGSQIPMPMNLNGLNSKITSLYDVEGSFVHSRVQANTQAAAFETINGETIVTYYNPNCSHSMNEMAETKRSSWYYTSDKICINFIYDLNGNKGPNTVGKDIGFMSAIYPTDTILVAPFIASGKVKKGVDQQEAYEFCRSLDDDYRLPNIDETSAMFWNIKLIGESEDLDMIWSSTVANSSLAWFQTLGIGRRYLDLKTRSDVDAVCVKR